VLGLAAGTVGGLLGVGGGVVIVPGLVLILGFNQHLAHGTSLLALLVMSIAGTLTYLAYGHTNLPLAAAMGVGGVVGALIGSSTAHRSHGRVLRWLFSALLVFVGVRMALHGLSGNDCPAAHAVGIAYTPVFITGALGTGLVAGTLGSMLGVAGGFLTVPALVILLGLEQKTAQGVSFAAMPIALAVGVLVYRSRGLIDVASAEWVGLGGALGVFFGGTIASRLPSPCLKLIFGAALVLIAIAMALKRSDNTVEEETLPCRKTSHP